MVSFISKPCATSPCCHSTPEDRGDQGVTEPLSQLANSRARLELADKSKTAFREILTDGSVSSQRQSTVQTPGGGLAFITGDNIEQQVDAGAIGIVVGVPGDLCTDNGLNSQFFAVHDDIAGESLPIRLCCRGTPTSGMTIRSAALGRARCRLDDYAGGYRLTAPAVETCLFGRTVCRSLSLVQRRSA